MFCLFILASISSTDALVARSSCPAGQVPWPSGTRCEDMASAKQRALQFLRENMPPWDVINKGTLELGILPATVQQALEVRQNFSWAAKVPEDVWRDYVLPYASVNEARSDWRPLLFQTLNLLDDPSKSLGDVAMFVNEHLWSYLNATKPVYFKAQQTPLIYDPMSAIAYGFASCTGLSILYLDALRSVGVPARLVGTPAWHGKYEDGNHNWVARTLISDVQHLFLIFPCRNDMFSVPPIFGFADTTSLHKSFTGGDLARRVTGSSRRSLDHHGIPTCRAWRETTEALRQVPGIDRINPKVLHRHFPHFFSRKLASASWSLLALASSGAAPRHHVNIH